MDDSRMCTKQSICVSITYIQTTDDSSAAHEMQVKWKTLSAALKIPVLNSRTTTQKTKEKTHKQTNKRKKPRANKKGMVHYGNLRPSP